MERDLEMKVCGIGLVVLAVLIWLVAASAEITAPGATVVNLALMNFRIALFETGGFLLVCGCVFIAAGAIADRLAAVADQVRASRAPAVQRVSIEPGTPAPPLRAPPLSEWRAGR